MIGRLRENWANKGIEEVFMHNKRDAQTSRPIFDGEAGARLIALAFSEPPQGHVRWTLRLLADKVMEPEIVEKTHFNTVGRVLKKTNSNHTAVVIG